MKNPRILYAAAVAAFVLTSSVAQAQATRTWVSGVGDDANPCSRTAPCKTFAGAISKTAAAGTINVLDPGGFGGVTITKSISIEAVGDIAGVLVAGTNGIIVNAGVTDVVVLRGLALEGLGTGLAGIKVIAVGKLIVEDCTINNFTQVGIDFSPNQVAPPPGGSPVPSLAVRNTVIRNNQGALSGGILVKPLGTAKATAMLSGVQLLANSYGLYVADNATVTVRDSVSTLNSAAGFIVVSTGLGPAAMNITDSISSSNGGKGVRSAGSGATAWIGNTTVTGNLGGGIIGDTSGLLISLEGNRVSDNLPFDGVPTSTVPTL